ncbi:MAG: arsenite methyltransferase [Verrucomicrobia bacterium]|nr:arsenite methyltransferase [Verrucomicrobiota bacterium]
MSTNQFTDEAEAVRAAVRDGYGKIAVGTSQGCCGPGVSCCGSAPADAEKLAKQIGYTTDELAALPEGANMGLSCGNPAALAALKPGEVVLDLGSGGGFDVFIAGRKVGPTGRAVGVDMTPDMLSKARRNVAKYREQTGLDNVEFRLGEIEHLSVADASVDVIISNCVINLSPDKPQVWREMARVLKPGGRVAVSDLALLRPLPPAIAKMVEALIGCVAGAVLVSETERMAREAGLTELVLTPKPDYVNVMTDWNDPLYRKIVEQLPAGTNPGDFITSLEVKARRSPSPRPETAAEANGRSVYSPAVGELVAIGAAIAANCEPCFKYHYDQARQLGVAVADMTLAVNQAQSVKQAPARAVLELAERFLHGDFAPRPETACCPGTSKTVEKPAKCCS